MTSPAGGHPPALILRADGRVQRVETGRSSCAAAIGLSVAEYESVRRDATRFAVVSGHQIEDVKDVVDRTDRYVVVLKHPERTTRIR